MSDFKSLGLAPRLQSALDALGYSAPTPIQLQAIPKLLKGRDLMGIAQTGTGKTAAFALPTLHHLCRDHQDPPKRGTRVLVLAPTRELASQIAESFRDYGRNIDHLVVNAVFGGVSMQKQIQRVTKGMDVLVATPGRLLDLIGRKVLTLRDVEVLILDEADQMMDMGFIHDLKKIVPLVPKSRQTLFFSATMAPKIANLAKQYLTDPVKIEIAPANTTAERVTQSLIFVNQAEKPQLLALALLEPDVERSLVFTRTKHGADRVVKRLRNIGIAAVAIHGNKSQAQRQRALGQFRDGEVTVLVATDVAARGIDIDNISHVFNYEIPNVAEQYVHRIGRTARGGAAGKAIAFVAKDERPYLKDIQKLLKMQIPVDALPDDFLAKANALNSREALPPPPKPAPDTRKGRGKSKRKNRKSKEARPSTDRSSGRKQTPAKPQRASEAKPSQGAKPQSKAQSKTPSKTPSNTMSRSDFDAKLKSAQQKMSGDLKEGPARGRKPAQGGSQSSGVQKTQRQAPSQGEVTARPGKKKPYRGKASSSKGKPSGNRGGGTFKGRKALSPKKNGPSGRNKKR